MAVKHNDIFFSSEHKRIRRVKEDGERKKSRKKKEEQQTLNHKRTGTSREYIIMFCTFFSTAPVYMSGRYGPFIIMMNDLISREREVIA
jgi:hypothetical protein